MSLDLDERRRAMLAEMGVRVFEPLAPASAPALTAPAPAPTARVTRVEPPAARETAPATIARPDASPVELMEWDALADAVAACRACGLCEGRRNTVFGVGDRQADWLGVGQAPGEYEDRQGEP